MNNDLALFRVDATVVGKQLVCSAGTCTVSIYHEFHPIHLIAEGTVQSRTSKNAASNNKAVCMLSTCVQSKRLHPLASAGSMQLPIGWSKTAT